MLNALESSGADVSRNAPVDVAPWLLVHTKPKQERLAEHLLGERGLPVYCPRALEPRLYPTAPLGPVPLFPSYVFCRASVADTLAAIVYCPGVHRLIRFGDTFAVLENADVDFLRAREEGRGHIVIPGKPLRVGGRVRLTAGPFKDMEAIIERYVPAAERVRLLLKVASGTWHVQVSTKTLRSLDKN